MKNILFVCVGNSGRSQIAEAYFNNMAGEKGRAQSAGTVPSRQVDRDALALMKEDGIDISLAQPKLLTKEMVDKADRVITMGCGVEDVCPARWIATEDWGLEDPKGKPVEFIRSIRDDIKARIEKLIKEL